MRELPAVPANLVVMPALATVNNEHIKHVVTELTNNGVHSVSPDLRGLRGRPEHWFEVEPMQHQLDELVDINTSVFRRTNGLLIINPVTEFITHGLSSYEVPNSVGHLALRMARAAKEVYGPNSGRIFLSEKFPDDSLPKADVAAQGAKNRIASLRGIKPDALCGNMARAVYAAGRSTSDDRRALRKVRRDGERGPDNE